MSSLLGQATEDSFVTSKIGRLQENTAALEKCAAAYKKEGKHTLGSHITALKAIAEDLTKLSASFEELRK